MKMNFTINLKNDYIYDLGYYNLGESTLLPNKVAGTIAMGKSMSLDANMSDARVLEVQGVGALMVQVLGSTVVDGYADAVPKSVEVKGEGEDQKIVITPYKYGAIVKYANIELYCKSDDTDVTLDLTIDKYGTLTPTKISSGDFGMIKIPEFSIK